MIPFLIILLLVAVFINHSPKPTQRAVSKPVEVRVVSDRLYTSAKYLEDM